MGNTWEVCAWQSNKHGAWEYVVIYDGASVVKACYSAIKAKRTCWCVRIVWR